jgi:acetyl esterase/lipase
MLKMCQGVIRIILLLNFMLAATVSAEVTFKSDVVYGHKDGMALVYDVLMPDTANGAAIVFMMSGGWYSSWAPPEARARQFKDMLDAGFTLIPVYHGSAPRYHVPDAYSDVSRAVRHIKLNASNYGIDAERIGVTGGSAGGHLSLMLGLDSDQGNTDDSDEVMRVDNSVAAVVAYFPPVAFREKESIPVGIVNNVGEEELLSRFPALDYDPELVPTVSPILFVDAGDPPTLLIHGDQDPLVDVTHSFAIKAEFDKESVESELIVIPGGKHGFGGEDATRANKARLAWFEKFLLD